MLRPLQALIVFAFLATAGIPDALADGMATFKDVCADCHGPSGEGKPDLAPALKGNAFVKSASLDDLKAVVKDGRIGKNKRYAQFARGMPGQPVYDDALDEVVKYVKEDLQK